MKNYVRKNLQNDEVILLTKRLHWIIYAAPLFQMLLGVIPLALAPYFASWRQPLYAIAVAILVSAIVNFVRRWFKRFITELTVTNRRIVFGQSFIVHHSIEMNMNKVEAVHVDQSMLGRIIGFGTVHVLGTGQSIEHLHGMADPLAVRSAIIAS